MIEVECKTDRVACKLVIAWLNQMYNLHCDFKAKSGPNLGQNNDQSNHIEQSFFVFPQIGYNRYCLQQTPIIINTFSQSLSTSLHWGSTVQSEAHRFFNPLSPDIKMHILITDLHAFLMKLVRRICLNIKKYYPQWSLPLFLSLEYSNKQWSCKEKFHFHQG